MRSLYLALCLVCASVCGYGQALTTVTDTIYLPAGGTFTGTVTIAASAPISNYGIYYGQIVQKVTVANGAFTTSLVPNDTATPSSKYAVTYTPAVPGQGYSEIWYVYTSGSALTISQVRAWTGPFSGIQINPRQISTFGSAPGQCLANVAGLVGYINCTLNITSVFGRVGAVVAQTGDYTAAQVTNAVDQTQSYSNPSWLNSLAVAKITGLTFTGSTTKAVSNTGGTMTSGDLGSWDGSGNLIDSNVLVANLLTSNGGPYLNPSWLTGIPYSIINTWPGSSLQYIAANGSVVTFPSIPTISGSLPLKGNGGNAVAAGFADIVGLWTAGGTCSGSSNFLRVDGQCQPPPGAVTSVSFPTSPAWLTGTIASPTTTPAISLTATGGQTTHEVIGTCNGATTFAPCALVASDLPSIPWTQLTGVPSYQPLVTQGTSSQYFAADFSIHNVLTVPTITGPGMLKYSGGNAIGATAGTDYLAPFAGTTSQYVTGANTLVSFPTIPSITGPGMLKYSAGNAVPATAGVDYQAAIPFVSAGDTDYYNGSSVAILSQPGNGTWCRGYSGGVPSWVTCPGASGSGLTSVGVGLTSMSWLSVSNSPLTVNGTIGLAPTTGQTSHQVIGTCGSATTFGACALVAGDIPSLNYQTPIATGTTSQYITGAGTLVSFPTIPTITGTSPLKGSGGNAIAAGFADIVGLWVTGGTCTGTSNYLRVDGTCAAPSGGGTVTITGSPASGNMTKWSGASSITNAVAGTDFAAATNGTSAQFLTSNGAGGYGTAVSGSGSGSVCLTTNCSMTTPALGTPSAIVLTNGTSLPATSLTGTIAAARMPAFTGGDITSSAGSVAPVVVALNSTNLAGLATGLIKNTTSTGVPSIGIPGTDYPNLPSFCVSTPGPTPGWNAASCSGGAATNAFSLNMTYAGAESPTFSGATTGQRYTFAVTNNASTLYALTLPPAITGACPMSPSLSGVTIFGGVWNGSTLPIDSCSISDTATIWYGPTRSACNSPASSSFLCVEFDNTAQTVLGKNSTGAVFAMPVTTTAATTGQFVTYIDQSGVVHVAAPVKVNNVSFSASPSPNQVPVITGTNASTWESLPFASIATAALQGTDSLLLTAGTFTGATGANICKDANSGATTTGCANGNVLTSTANTYTAGDQNFSAAASVELPASGGATPVTAGQAAIDSTQVSLKYSAVTGPGTTLSPIGLLPATVQTPAADCVGVVVGDCGSNFGTGSDLVFTTQPTVPGYLNQVGKVFEIHTLFKAVVSASAPNITYKIKFNTTTVMQSVAAQINASAITGGVAETVVSCWVVSSSTLSCGPVGAMGSSTPLGGRSTIVGPTSVTINGTSTPNTLYTTILFASGAPSGNSVSILGQYVTVLN